jgi:uncharacterized protein (TIGR03437 family)
MSASVLAPPFKAQVATSSNIRVRTYPEQVLYFADGQGSRTATTYSWPTGTKHTLYGVPVDEATRVGVRYSFSSWSIAGQILAEGNPVTITADPSISEVRAEYKVEYGLTVNLISCDEPPCAPPGRVYAAGAPLTETTIVWATPGGTIQLQAVPNPGYVFAGWGNTNRGQVTQGFLNTVTVNEPMAVTPMFQPARKIDFETVPDRLQILADRAPVNTPATLEWGRGSTHSLTVVSPQQDPTGAWWVFSSWTHGGAMTQAYTVDASVASGKIVATFTPAMKVTLATSPNGLKLKVDGREGQPPYNPVWGVGETHRVEAPLQQTDAQGRTWAFDSWSDGQPAARSFTVPDAEVGLGQRLVATYRQLGRISISSNLSGGSATVDGAECQLPCSVDRPLGTPVTVSVPARVSLGDSSRAEFDRWSDGSSGALSLVAAPEPKSLTATYRTLHRLLVTADPFEGAVCRTAPDSNDGFFDSSTVVTVTASARGGFRFRRWEGDVNVALPQGTVLMNQPRAARAIFDRVPYIPPSGVRNAAAELPAEGVAPGSLVSMNGSHLAGNAVTGPESPLSQTLGDVTVRFGDRLLPLYFVSPERITAQLPPDATDGQATAAARWANQEEVRAEFKVVRNAPGLFSTTVDDQALVVASHADGTSVTPASPARRGEVVTLFGTGFGPTEPQRPWGFAVPDAPAYRLVDAVTVQLGDRPLVPETAVAAQGKVGIDSIQVRVPGDVAGGGLIPLVAQAGGRDSNKVFLPVE